MKTIIWKELRQCGRYVAVGFVVMALAVSYTLYSSGLIFDESQQWPSYAILIGSVFAMALGMLQCRGDNVPAARALLLHRAVDVSTVFWGKLFSGAIMFITAIVTPFLCLMFYFAIDDRQTIAAHPWDVLPGLVGALAGFVFWPVAVSLVHSDAKFFGSRLLSLVGSAATLIGLSVAIGQTENRWIWLLLVVVPLAVVTTIARHQFVQSRMRQTAPRFSLWFVNAFALLLLFVAGAGTWFDSSYTGSRYFVTFGPNAEPRLVEQAIGHTTQRIRVAPLSTEGSVRNALKGNDEEMIGDYYQAVTWTRPDSRQSMIRLNSFRQPGPNGDQFRAVFDNLAGEILVYRDQGFGPQLARILSDESNPYGRFVGQSRLVPSDGLPESDPLESDQPGRGTAVSWNLLACENGLYRFGDELETVSPLMKFPSGAAVGSIVSAITSSGLSHGSSIRVDDEVLLLGAVHHPASTSATETFKIQRVRIPSGLRQFDSFYLTRSPQSESEFIGIGYPTDSPLQLTDVVKVQFDRNGDVRDQTVYREFVGNVSDRRSIFSPAAFVPLGAFVVVGAVDAFVSGTPDLFKRMWTITTDDSLHVIWLVITLILGVVVAIWVAMRRELDQRSMIASCLAGAVFGPVGALAILTVFPRINRQPCAACGKPTRVDHCICRHCGIRDDDLPRRGIEIFDDMGSRLEAAQQPC